jgi:hypothetical protein
VQTPWGYADYQSKLDGTYQGQYVEITDIVQVSTPSHGGLGINTHAGDIILSDYAKSEAIKSNGYYWFEEDCDWALLILEFNKFEPNILSEQLVEDAKKCAESWHANYAVA